jgi:hypothetical protein
MQPRALKLPSILLLAPLPKTKKAPDRIADRPTINDEKILESNQNAIRSILKKWRRAYAIVIHVC